LPDTLDSLIQAVSFLSIQDLISLSDSCSPLLASSVV